MVKKLFFFISLFIVFNSYSQSEKNKNIIEINKVWQLFYEAFAELDYTKMAKIHSKNLIRVSGGKTIMNYEKYINNYKISFENSKKTNQTSAIELRFFERLNSNTNASERGIYRLTRNKGTTKEKHYYGKFHVIFTKENNEWKILVDYDSNENNTIGETQFFEAFEMYDFKMFIK